MACRYSVRDLRLLLEKYQRIRKPPGTRDLAWFVVPPLGGVDCRRLPPKGGTTIPEYGIVAVSVYRSRMRTLQCKCGYDFSDDMLAQMRGAGRRCRSFAVIDDENYSAFLKSERKVLKADSKKKRTKAIAKSARFVGTMAECPDCARMVMNLPDGDTTTFYVREE